MQPIRQVAFASSGSLLRPCRTRNVGNPGGIVTFWILSLATPSPHSDGNGGDDTHVLINQYPPVRKPGRAQLSALFPRSTGDLPPLPLCRPLPPSACFHHGRCRNRHQRHRQEHRRLVARNMLACAYVRPFHQTRQSSDSPTQARVSFPHAQV